MGKARGMLTLSTETLAIRKSQPPVPKPKSRKFSQTTWAVGPRYRCERFLLLRALLERERETDQLLTRWRLVATVARRKRKTESELASPEKGPATTVGTEGENGEKMKSGCGCCCWGRNATEGFLLHLRPRARCLALVWAVGLFWKWRARSRRVIQQVERMNIGIGSGLGPYLSPWKWKFCTSKWIFWVSSKNKQFSMFFSSKGILFGRIVGIDEENSVFDKLVMIIN